MEKRKPEFITFTGIDDRTDLARAFDLASEYRIEWGILISKTSRRALFPSEETIAEILEDLPGRKAAHLCGSLADAVAKGERIDSALFRGFPRVQINTRLKRSRAIARWQHLDNLKAIVQLWDDAFPLDSQVLYLFDQSAGRGILPKAPPKHPDGETLVGYAGGMGPKTVLCYLERIPAEGLGPYWVDMESQVRTGGWFDLDKVEAVCRAVYG